MKIIFLEKYKLIYIHHDLREEVFKMTQNENESLKYLLERFTYNVKRAKLHDLGLDTLKTLLLKSIRDEWIDILKLMSKGDVSQLYFQEICELCKHISRGKLEYGSNPRDQLCQ